MSAPPKKRSIYEILGDNEKEQDFDGRNFRLEFLFYSFFVNVQTIFIVLFFGVLMFRLFCLFNLFSSLKKIWNETCSDFISTGQIRKSYCCLIDSQETTDF